MITGWMLMAVAILVEVRSHDHVVAILLLILSVLTVIALRVDEISKDLKNLGQSCAGAGGSEPHPCNLHPRR